MSEQVASYKLSATTFPISHVTLYARRAEVKRVITAKLKAGENEVVISDLPTQIVQDSLRVEGISTFNTTLKHVSLSQVPTASVPVIRSDKLKELENEISEARSEIERVIQRSKALQSYMDKVDPEYVKVDQLEAIFDFHATTSPKFHSSVKNMEEKVKDLGVQMEVERQRIIAEERDKMEGRNQALRSKAKVGVWSTQEGEISLTLIYAVTGATWRPLYDARIKSSVDKESGDKPVVLTYKATISQSSGEDWTAVSLTLSTSQPTTSTVPPTLYPWNIHFFRPPPPPPLHLPRPRSPPAPALAAPTLFGRSAVLNRMAAAPAPVIPEPTVMMESTGATAQQGVLSATFEVPGKTTVLSDDKEKGKTVTIAELPLFANLEWSAVPRQVEKVYLNSKVRNNSDYQLLAGPVAVYLDGSFVANAHLKDVSVNEEFPINLGVDPSIRITYPGRAIKTSISGLINKTKTHTFTQRIIIHNSKSTAITLLLKDQIPVSQDQSLTVKLLTPNLPGETIEEPDVKQWKQVANLKGVWARWAVDESLQVPRSGREEGMVEWKVEVDKGMKGTILLEFEVQTGTSEPAIVGLERVS